MLSIKSIILEQRPADCDCLSFPKIRRFIMVDALLPSKASENGRLQTS
jgi:hypothetical protein